MRIPTHQLVYNGRLTGTVLSVWQAGSDPDMVIVNTTSTRSTSTITKEKSGEVVNQALENRVEIPIVHEPLTVQKFSEVLKTLDRTIDVLSPLKDLGVQMENIELMADQAAKRAIMSTLPDPREAVLWKRRKVITQNHGP